MLICFRREIYLKNTGLSKEEYEANKNEYQALYQRDYLIDDPIGNKSQTIEKDKNVEEKKLSKNEESLDEEVKEDIKRIIKIAEEKEIDGTRELKEEEIKLNSELLERERTNKNKRKSVIIVNTINPSYKRRDIHIEEKKREELKEGKEFLRDTHFPIENWFPFEVEDKGEKLKLHTYKKESVLDPKNPVSLVFMFHGYGVVLITIFRTMLVSLINTYPMFFQKEDQPA